MGYDQALARVSELRGLTRGEPAPAATTPAASAASAAAFQQQLAMAGSGSGDPTATGGFTPDVTALAGGDPYAALQGGGLSAQAAMLSQLGLAPDAFGGAVGIGGAAGVGGAAPIAPTNVTGKTDRLDPELLQRLDAVGRELGQKIDVISGHRSFEEQSALYQKYLNGTGNLAAPPGA